MLRSHYCYIFPCIIFWKSLLESLKIARLACISNVQLGRSMDWSWDQHIGIFFPSHYLSINLHTCLVEKRVDLHGKETATDKGACADLKVFMHCKILTREKAWHMPAKASLPAHTLTLLVCAASSKIRKEVLFMSPWIWITLSHSSSHRGFCKNEGSEPQGEFCLLSTPVNFSCSIHKDWKWQVGGYMHCSICVLIPRSLVISRNVWQGCVHVLVCVCMYSFCTCTWIGETISDIIYGWEGF